MKAVLRNLELLATVGRNRGFPRRRQNNVDPLISLGVVVNIRGATKDAECIFCHDDAYIDKLWDPSSL